MNRVQHGSTAPESAAQQLKIEVQTDSGHAAESAPLDLPAMDVSAAIADEPALSDLFGENSFGEPSFSELSFAQEPAAQDSFAEQPDSSSLPHPAKARPLEDSAMPALPLVRFLGQLLSQHPTIFWSGVWVITLLCSGIAVTGLMNPDLSSQQGPPGQTGVGAVLRATRLDSQKPASPAVSFGLLAVSCAGCCLLLSRRFQSPQSLCRPASSKHWRSPAKSAIAAELEAIATLASDAALDSGRSLPVPSRQPWIDAALLAVQSKSSSVSPASRTADSQTFQAPQRSQESQTFQVAQAPQALDYLSYLRVHAQSRAQSQRTSHRGGRSPLSHLPPQADLSGSVSSPHTIASYTPDPALPVAFFAPSSEAFSPGPAAQPALPAVMQPLFNLSQPHQPQPDSLTDTLPETALTLAELRKIQAKRALREVE